VSSFSLQAAVVLALFVLPSHAMAQEVTATGGKVASLSIEPAGVYSVHGARAALCDLMFKDSGHPPSGMISN
jgi:hypothetical protein